MGKQWRTRIAVGGVACALLICPTPAGAAPVPGAGHFDMAWTVTDASGSPPPPTFGPGGGAPWAGADRVWKQPGFTGSYRITLNGAAVAGYCGDFHNPNSPDASSTWTVDRNAFVGSDKALAKLSYAQWRWGGSTNPDIGAALNLYTHFLGSPGDRSNRSGVPIPDINDNDVLDEIVTTLPPHAAVAPIMYSMDADAEMWSAAFGHSAANIAAGVNIEMVDGSPVLTSTATGRLIPSATYDLVSAGRTATATTAGVAQPLRDITAGSQNSITAGATQTARRDFAPEISVASQISDATPSIGTRLTDSIVVAGLLDGETAAVRVELLDLSVDPSGNGPALATEMRSDLGNGPTTGWAPFDVTVAVAGHRLGYRHRLESIKPRPASGVLPADWSELGIASETGTADDLQAGVHIRQTVSSSSRPGLVNAQRDTEPSHRPAPAPLFAADGSHDDGLADDGDALPVYVQGDAVSFRYEIWLADESTGDVVWSAESDSAEADHWMSEIIIDDAGTKRGDDDFVPTYVAGDDGDGRLSKGEVWTFEARGQRQAAAGERYVNVASVAPGAIVNPVNGERTDGRTAIRFDPAGYIVPCLSTSVADHSDGDRVLDPGGGTLIDLATYCNLIPGEAYVIHGVAVVQETGEHTAFRGATAFVPDSPDGSVEVKIVVDDAIGAGDYVIFETVISEASGDVVAIHADLDDEAQTFTVRAAEVAPPTTTSPTTTTPTTTSPTLVPPSAASPPTLPKTGNDAAHLAGLAGLALFTAGIVLMEARHGRIRR